MEQKIPYCEVKFHPHSFANHHIRLFRWNGQIYRGISSEGAAFFTQLFRDGVIQRLTEQGLLIETELTPLVIDGYEMVVRHRYIPFTSYPNEWCAAMFKNAALTLIELAIELAQRGLTLGDAHPWNLLFDIDTCKPVFVDLGSIGSIDDSMWPAYDEFCRFCLYPLIFMSHEQDQIARLLMCEDKGVLKSDILMLTRDSVSVSIANPPVISRLKSALRQRVPHQYRQQLKRRLSSMRSLFRQQSHDLKSPLDFLEKIRREVESITLPSCKTEWSDHYGKSSLSFSPQDGWTVKQKSLQKILTELRPSSLLDIGCNTGWYSKLAAHLGSKVVAFDTDEKSITQLYYDARDNKLPILPLIMDFTKPTPSRGLANHWAIAATERFQCDMVIALALVHHIVLERRLNFEQIVEGLALFSQRWVVVEFIPREDQEVCKWWSSKFYWYTLDNFINTLRKRFCSVSIMPSHPEPRVLLLCEK